MPRMHFSSKQIDAKSYFQKITIKATFTALSGHCLPKLALRTPVTKSLACITVVFIAVSVFIVADKQRNNNG